MSFSIQGITNHTPAEAGELVKVDSSTPDQIKEYVMVSLLALRKRYGEGVKCAVTCHGHLHNGEEGNSPTTSCTVEVVAVGGIS
jgi:hypothetical protein